MVRMGWMALGMMVSGAAWAEGPDKADGPGIGVDGQVAPIVGWSTYSGPAQQGTGHNLVLGVRGAVNYGSQAPFGFVGRTYSRYEAVVGAARHGHDWRLGSHIGPRLSVLSLLGGVEVSHTGYEWGNASLKDAWWVGAPLMARVDVSIVQIYAGVTPFWHIGGADASSAAIASWPNDGSAGGADSWEVFGGVGVRLGPLRLGLSSQFRTYGPHNQVVTNLGLTYGFKKAKRG